MLSIHKNKGELTMTIQQAIDKIIAYHPPIDESNTCDFVKCGDPNAELTGIVTTCCASVDVVRQAIALGANLIVCHEPTFYTHMDDHGWLQGKNRVFDEKLQLCEENGIVIWRDHDHIHAHRPDGIRYGVMKELGWEEYLIGDPNEPDYFCLPETTVRDLALYLKEKVGLNAVRMIGDPESIVRNVKMCWHILPGDPLETEAVKLLERDDVDVLMPGEMIDWTAACFARDAAQLGKNKAIIQLGHINYEELGMKYAAVWLQELFGGAVPVQFVRSADLYNYVY